MAIVFKAKEKQLRPRSRHQSLPFRSPSTRNFVERFQREARTSAKLEHPNIIPIYRVGKSGRVIYFVMNFLRGKPAVHHSGGTRTLPPGEIRKMLGEVSRALAYAHRRKSSTATSSPDNIMVRRARDAVVTDFGIAKGGVGRQS